MRKIIVYCKNCNIHSTGNCANKKIYMRPLNPFSSALVTELSGKFIIGIFYGNIIKIRELFSDF